MRLFHPRSTLTLILFGFGVVALPLFVALGYAGFYVDRLAEQGQTTVYNAARAIQGSRSLSETLTNLERTARQYLLLNDKSLLKTYKQDHDSFQSLVTRLEMLTPEAPHQTAVKEIGRQEQTLYERLSDEKTRAKLSQDDVAKTFTRLGQLADAIRIGSNRVIDHEVDVMQETATTAQRWLFWMGVSLIPLTLISTAIFTVLISRPIRQVDRAIRELGDGRFERSISVSGPEDLRALGERLDWLRRRLTELENQKTRFLRHVSHELKTPLTAIRESSDLLGDEVVGPLNADQREITHILADSGRQLQSLIEDLLDFSRTQSHRPRLNVTRIDLRAMVEELIQAHKPALLARGLKLDSQIKASHLHGDREKLRTIVDNLLSNAIKFSPEGGTLRIRTMQSGGAAVIAVADEGPGIPASERERIFDAFFQGETQPDGYVRGSGLGLSIAREYVEAHGGRIELVDTGGRGASFRLVFPRRSPRNLSNTTTGRASAV